MSNRLRRMILSGFEKFGKMRVLERYSDTQREYMPVDGFVVGLYVAESNEDLPVRDVSSFPPGSHLETICSRYDFPPLNGERAVPVGCLVVDPYWNAKLSLESREEVQFQAFSEGLVAVPLFHDDGAPRDFIIRDPVDRAELLAITMQLEGSAVVSTLHWLKDGVVVTDSWRWPD